MEDEITKRMGSWNVQIDRKVAEDICHWIIAHPEHVDFEWETMEPLQVFFKVLKDYDTTVCEYEDLDTRSMKSPAAKDSNYCRYVFKTGPFKDLRCGCVQQAKDRCAFHNSVLFY